MRTGEHATSGELLEFLSIQAQDFIEERRSSANVCARALFLSIQAQDFIEETIWRSVSMLLWLFLSIQAQDFIEEA